MDEHEGDPCLGLLIGGVLSALLWVLIAAVCTLVHALLVMGGVL